MWWKPGTYQRSRWGSLEQGNDECSELEPQEEETEPDAEDDDESEEKDEVGVQEQGRLCWRHKDYSQYQETK